ncbi:MAG: hypothetical protein QOG31_1410 [Thermoplasmata archaeon]|jgi:hypothetical protein|nr:hypothetical protein [Thermoplasmata archaeon]
MAQLKKCPYCHGLHRKKSAYNKCKRRLAPRPTWGK